MSNYNRRSDGESNEEFARRRKKQKVNLWMCVGVAVLIALLLIWLTIADFWGDTDVAAAIAPRYL